MRWPRIDLSRRSTRIVLGVMLVLLVAVAGVRWLLGPEVAAYAVARREVTQRVVASGRVLAPARVQLASLSLAQVRDVLVREGDPVAPGQVVVVLDDAEAKAVLAQAQAGVAQAAARLEQVRTVTSRVALENLKQAELSVGQAESKLKRAEALAVAGAVSQADLDDAKKALALARSQQETAATQAMSAAAAGSDFRLAVAALAQARAAEVAAETRLAQTQLRAPAPGLVLERHVERGDVVQPGRPLIILASAGATVLATQPDEKNLAVLAIGQPATAAADAFPDQIFPARVTYIAPAVDPARGTVEVRLEVDKPPAFLRTDMTVSVNIEVARRPDALVVPGDAVQDAATRPWVITVRDGRTERKSVTLGLRTESWVEVTAGLAEAELVLAGRETERGAGARVRPQVAPFEGADAL
jgi:HlyD family secretion protein